VLLCRNLRGSGLLLYSIRIVLNLELVLGKPPKSKVHPMFKTISLVYASLPIGRVMPLRLFASMIRTWRLTRTSMCKFVQQDASSGATKSTDPCLRLCSVGENLGSSNRKGSDWEFSLATLTLFRWRKGGVL
jgi:hypothetical protein